MLQTPTTKMEYSPGSIEEIQVNRPYTTGPTKSIYVVVPGFQTLYEKYTPNSSGFKKARRWKAFSHYKRTCNQPSNPSGVVISVDIGPTSDMYAGILKSGYALYSGEFGDPGKSDYALPVLNNESAGADFVPAPVNAEQLNATALRSMLPLIRPELSILNSIYELKDFKSTALGIKRLLSDPRLGLTNFKILLRSLKGSNTSMTLKRLLRASASGYLNLKFNYLSLLSDICSVYRALQRTQKRINALVSRSGRPQTSHFSTFWYEFLDDNHTNAKQGGFKALYEWSHPGVFSEVNLPCWVTYERQVLYEPTTFHAELQYNYNYTGYQVANAQLLGFLDAFGLNLNPAIIWNAIPWSFVIDWVLGVSRALNQMALTNMEPKINILQYLWSVRRARSIYLKGKVAAQIYYSSSTKFYPPGYIVRPAIREEAYRRFVGMPSTSSLQMSGLSPTELSLGAALVITRRRRH